MSGSEPRVWVLLGPAAGDNALLLRLAEALELGFETRTVLRKPASETPKIAVQPSLHYVDPDRSDRLEPPWPDLVITIGRNRSLAALWIKEQAGGRTKVVLVGGAKSQSRRFDLIIASMDYPAPDQPNVCRIGLRLSGIDRAKLDAAALPWAAKLSHFERPLTVLLIGGPSETNRFDAATARAVLAATEAARARDGGTLYISSSRRTPKAAVAALAEALPPRSVLYRWQPDDPGNPYLGLLANGDRFVVTGDSLSMLVEIARLGKPLAIAPTGPPKATLPALLTRFGSRRLWEVGEGLARDVLWPFLGLFSERARWSGPRNIQGLHDYLYRGGWAVRLGEPFVAPGQPPPDDTPLAVSRIRALLSTNNSAIQVT